jgi:hypothetical protein
MDKLLTLNFCYNGRGQGIKMSVWITDWMETLFMRPGRTLVKYPNPLTAEIYIAYVFAN